jgi:hypothetical protein
MTRLLIVAEGLTEFNFVTQVLKPHLEWRSASDHITVTAPNLRGYRMYAAFKKFVKSLPGSPESDAIVTTMIDLFKIPSDFAGLAEASDALPNQRVRQLEQRFTENIGDPRFFAYLQLHEFEALLLADLTLRWNQRPNRRKEIDDLSVRLRRDFASPELVDRLRPPSYWIREAVPEYIKTVDGPVTGAVIGLAKLSGPCPHFGQWLQRLEALSRDASIHGSRS